MNRHLTVVAALVVAVALFLGINVLANATLTQSRLDLTENRLYTLSEGSKSVLEKLEEPVTLRFFYSAKLANEVPQINTYATRVRELLEEYADLSDGMLRLEVIDPEPFSEAEDRAVQAGVQGVPLDPASGKRFYFGLVGTGTTDQQEVIPFFQQQRETFLEYDLTKLIYSLGTPERPVLAVISDLPLEYGPGGMMAAMQGQARPYQVLSTLRQQFELRMLKNDVAAIDEDVGVLLVVHPKALPPATQYAIDQFVLRGGRAMIFVDPFAETEPQQPGPMGMADPSQPRSSNLPRLFEAWGLEMPEEQFVADRRLAIRVTTGESQRVVDYAAWLEITDAERNRADVVTAELGVLNLASVGALSPLDGATTEFLPLLTSSTEAALMEVERIRMQPNPEALLTAIEPTGERYVLAARIRGPARSAFPDGPPAPAAEGEAAEGEPAETAETAETTETAENEPPAASHLAESAQPINLIVVADADMLDDRFWVRVQDFFGQRVAVPVSANADFLVNGIDNLGGSEDLISLRTRGGSTRPFTVIEDLRREAGQRFLAREQALQQKLEQTEQRIAELQSKAPEGGSALLSAEEQAAIDGFREEMVRTRRELRDVQHSLNRDIEQLEARVKFANIGLVPIAVSVLAIGMAAVRRRRRRARSDARD